MCNVRIEKQYGFIAMQSASARNRSLMPRMHTSTPQATHHTHILFRIIVLNIVHKRKNMKKCEHFFVLILLEIRNTAIIAGIQRLFQGNFKHFMVLLVLFFQRQKFRWCKYFCFFFHVYHCLKSYCKCK